MRTFGSSNTKPEFMSRNALLNPGKWTNGPCLQTPKHTVKWLKWERPHAGCSCGPSIKGVSCHEMRVSVRGSVSLF